MCWTHFCIIIWYIFLYHHYPLNIISLIYCKIHSLYLPILCFVCDYVRLSFLKDVDSFNTFFSLLKEWPLYIYYEYQYHTIKKELLLHWLIDCISARSAPQILPFKDEYTLRFSSFVIIGLCNSSANCWFCITAPPEDFLSENL